MVLAALVRYGERLRAGIDAVGISDFASFLENTSPYRRQLRRAEYGDERDPEMRRFFAEIAPRRNISKLRSALFVIHGRNDPRVPISEALEVVAGARAAAQPVWTLFAANEGHGFERRENRDYEEAARALFLNRYLLGTELAKAAAEDPDRRGRFLHHRAGELFRETRFAESIRFYDAAVAAGHPHNEDACWERGLAYYYAGDFERGRRQFEGYHKVGPLDIENGIWRLLCTAKTEGLEKAREAFYPYPRKVRPPFPALHALFSGAGSPDAVFEEARSGAKDAELDERVFYAHYYVAKHFEAAGDAAKALQHLEEALRRPVNHFMADCARIDVERVRRTVRGSGGGKG
jgi:tetratricopeptide (TPR) repeat protein